jgi:hypothetical protein
MMGSVFSMRNENKFCVLFKYTPGFKELTLVRVYEA